MIWKFCPSCGLQYSQQINLLDGDQVTMTCACGLDDQTVTVGRHGTPHFSSDRVVHVGGKAYHRIPMKVAIWLRKVGKHE